ncbi:MAG TPA: tetratricopeptide repeat protein [Bacteroidetes bacterium]|nr:tetratricopeptide repeat protein [Bacteroidota bacterium]
MEQQLSPEKEIEQITRKLKNNPDDLTLLYRRAALLQQVERFGEALNDLHRIMEIHPEYREARERARFLETILKFTNLDIFSDTNTDHDPWFD